MKKGIKACTGKKESVNSGGSNSKTLPPSIKAIIAYCIIIGVVYIAYFIIGIYAPATLFFGQLVQGYAAIIIDLLILIVLSFVIYGLFKMEKWAYKLAIGWFLFGIFNSLISLIVISPGFIRDLVFVSFIGVILLDGLVIWYMLTRKEYFYQKTFTHDVEGKDKFFMYLLAFLWIIIIVLSIVLGVGFYKDTTKKADLYINELRGVTKLHATVICDVKEGEDRDICFVVLANLYKKDDIKFVCDRVESQFYKFMCLKA